MIKAAIFDMDGLLIDSERIIMQACIHAAQAVGIRYTQDEYAALIGRAGPDSTRLMKAQLGGEDAFNQVMQGLDAQLALRNHAFPLKTGALKLLQHYQRSHVVCCVASSSSIHHISHRLQQAGVSEYFSHFTSGQEVARGKPNPDIYLLALEKLGLTAEACVVFEDSEVGARAAISAGLKVVVVPDLVQPSEYVREQAHYVLESLSHWLVMQH